MNNIHSTHLALHEMLDDSRAQYRLAHEQIKKYGLVLISPDGKHIPSPYIEIGNRYCERIIALSKELGLIPPKQ